jgi:hypothetical protein
MSDEKLNINLQNKKYVEDNIDNIRNLFNNKYIVVHDRQIEAAFSTYEEASRFGVIKFGLDDVFLVYRVEDTKSINFVALASL